MNIPAPALYRKTRDQEIEILEKGLKDVGIGWEGREGGPGWAFVRLFGRLSDLAVQRLNQVPDKHFFAFLNAAGVDFVPPCAAETELTFTLADDAPSSVLLPAGSQMATAKTETGAEIVFETAKDATLCKNVLVRAVAFDSRCASDRTGEAMGLEATSYPAFQGTVERSRILYLGDATFFSFDDDIQRAGTSITLTVDLKTPGQPEKDGWTVGWAYFDGNAWMPFPKDSVDDGTVDFSRSGQVVLKHLPLLLEKTLENGVNASLAITLSGGTGRKHLPVIRSIKGERSFSLSSVQASDAELCCAMQSGKAFVPVDKTGEFFPLGQRPVRLDALYIRDDAVFSKTGGTCTLSMTLSHAPDQDVASDAQIAWEYYDGTGWTVLAATTDTTAHFRGKGQVAFVFTVPPMVKTKVNEKEGLWIRARLNAGGYEKPGSVTQISGVMSWNPPKLAAPMMSRFTMVLSFPEAVGQKVSLTRAVAGVDGVLRDRSEELTSAQGVSPFSADDEGPAFYLGFDRAFPPEKWIQIRMDVDEDALEEEYGAPVAFEYFNGKGFSPLRVSDGTLGFKTRGYVGFFGPKDHEPSGAFGTPAFWIRIRPEGDGAEGPYLKTVRTNTVPAVNAETFRDVILGSSDGKADQMFRLPRTCVLPGLVLAVLEPDRPGDDELETLVSEIGRSEYPGPVFPCESDKWVRWVASPDFYDSTASSRHFTVDPVNGTVRFGDGERGAVPPIGRNNIRLVSVRYHDGKRGNVGEGAVSVVRNPAGDLVAVKKVVNVEAAAGGSDVESLEDIRRRGPQRLKHRERAVTLEDYEWIAREAGSEVKQVKCFPVTDALGKRKAGHVTVVITPESTARKPVPGPALIRKVRTHIENHALTNLPADRNIHVKGPSYVECSVNVTVTPVYPEQSDQVELAILKRLESFLHPLTGGPERNGWDLGRDVYLSEVSAEIEQVEGVDHVSALTFSCSLQQFHLGFKKEKNRFRRAPFDLASGSRAATFDESVRVLLADPVYAGSDIESITVYGFKAGDTVAVVTETQAGIIENLQISRVTPENGGPDQPLAWDIAFAAPFEPPADWDKRAGMVSADGRIRMKMTAEERTDGEGNITSVVIRAFSPTDRICLVQGNIREPELGFIPLASARLSGHRVTVPEDCLVYSGTHDVDMKIGD